MYSKDSFLTQHVTNCTRHRQGQQSSLLDLVLSSDLNFIDEVSNLSALGSSDHLIVCCGAISVMMRHLLLE